MINTKLIWIQRICKIQTDEVKIILYSFGMFFCLLCSYYILRPIRDSLAITGGVDKLHWLFMATFLGILLIVPVYGWACVHFRRIWLVTGVYATVVITLILFWLLFNRTPDNIWLARAFYVWVSVFNLLMVSVFWSLMVDIYSQDQAHRLFGLIAAGGSLGAIFGPLISAKLAIQLGFIDLLLISAFGFILVIILVVCLLQHVRIGNENTERIKPLGGNAFAGFFLVFKTPYLLVYALFILLMSTISTFLYFHQAALVGQALSNTDDRTQLFAWIDFSVNILSLISQMILTGNIVKRFGVSIILTIVPFVIMLGFISFIIYPQLTIVVSIIIFRRVGSYAFIRPCREMLFTSLSREAKYKAKSFIDTVIYRGGDALSGWFYHVCINVGLTLSGIALVGTCVAAACSFTGYCLGKSHDQS